MRRNRRGRLPTVRDVCKGRLGFQQRGKRTGALGGRASADAERGGHSARLRLQPLCPTIIRIVRESIAAASRLYFNPLHLLSSSSRQHPAPKSWSHRCPPFVNAIHPHLHQPRGPLLRRPPNALVRHAISALDCWRSPPCWTTSLNVLAMRAHRRSMPMRRPHRHARRHRCHHRCRHRHPHPTKLLKKAPTRTRAAAHARATAAGYHYPTTRARCT